MNKYQTNTLTNTTKRQKAKSISHSPREALSLTVKTKAKQPLIPPISLRKLAFRLFDPNTTLRLYIEKTTEVRTEDIKENTARYVILWVGNFFTRKPRSVDVRNDAVHIFPTFVVNDNTLVSMPE